MEMRPPNARPIRVAGEGYDIATFDILPNLDRRLLKQMTIKRDIAQVRMVDRKIMWRSAVREVVYAIDNPIGNRYNRRSTWNRKIYPKVKPLSGCVLKFPGIVRAHCIAELLGNKPCTGAGWCAEGWGKGYGLGINGQSLVASQNTRKTQHDDQTR
jgi:hypothetical protein